MNDLKLIWKILDPEARRRMLFLAILTTVSGFVEILGVSAVIPFIAVASGSDPSGVTHGLTDSLKDYCLSWGLSDQSLPVTLGTLLLVGLAISNILLCTYQYYNLVVTNQLSCDLSVRLVRSLSEKSLDWFGEKNSSDLSQSVLTEVGNAINSCLSPGVTCIAIFLRIFIMSSFFLYVQPRLACAVAIGLIIAYFLVVRVMGKPLERYGEIRAEAVEQMYRVSSEIFGGAREIRVTGSSNYFLDLFTSAAKRTVRPHVYRGMPAHLTRAGLEFSLVAITVVLLVYFRQRDGNLSTGLPLLSAYALAGIRFMPAVQQAMFYSLEFRFSLPSVRRIAALLDELPASNTLTDSLPSINFKKSMRFDGVEFCYPNSIPILKGLTFEIPYVSRVGLVGATGAGKSTVLDIILALRIPQEGTFSVDGVRITPENAACWQRHIGYVPQDIFLLDDTIINNVAFGIRPEEIKMSDVERACKAANIHDFITSDLPGGYQTVIGERGARLSGGQCQRLGIARALYHDPDVVVFDEATSSLDTATENVILNALEVLKGQKTLVVVAHRLNTVWDFDNLLVMDRGLLVAQGTARELAECCPKFVELLNRT